MTLAFMNGTKCHGLPPVKPPKQGPPHPVPLSWADRQGYPRACDLEVRDSHRDFGLPFSGNRQENVFEFPGAAVLVRPRLHHIHLSDQQKTKEHLCPGDGVLPIVPFVQRLQAIDFQGIVVLELSPEALPVEDEDQTVQRLRDVLAMCVKAVEAKREPALASA